MQKTLVCLKAEEKELSLLVRYVLLKTIVLLASFRRGPRKIFIAREVDISHIALLLKYNPSTAYES